MLLAKILDGLQIKRIAKGMSYHNRLGFLR